MRIHSIKLLTKQLEQLKKFYIYDLGVQLVESSSNMFTLKVGKSNLIFEQSDKNEKSPFYHFVIDIPENKIEESITWLNSVGVTLNLLPDNSYQVYSKT